MAAENGVEIPEDTEIAVRSGLNTPERFKQALAEKKKKAEAKAKQVKTFSSRVYK